LTGRLHVRGIRADARTGQFQSADLLRGHFRSTHGGDCYRGFRTLFGKLQKTKLIGFDLWGFADNLFLDCSFGHGHAIRSNLCISSYIFRAPFMRLPLPAPRTALAVITNSPSLRRAGMESLVPSPGP
ncbi:MAG: hypothetical protein ACK55Z_14375, partial [bacterium]